MSLNYPLCFHKHPMTPSNIYVHKKNGREECRECRRIRSSRWHSKHRKTPILEHETITLGRNRVPDTDYFGKNFWTNLCNRLAICPTGHTFGIEYKCVGSQVHGSVHRAASIAGIKVTVRISSTHIIVRRLR